MLLTSREAVVSNKDVEKYDIPNLMHSNDPRERLLQDT